VDFSEVKHPIQFLILLMLWRIIPPKKLPNDLIEITMKDLLPAQSPKYWKELFKNVYPQLMDELHLLESFSSASKKDANIILSQAFNYALRDIYEGAIEPISTKASAHWLVEVADAATKTFTKSPDKYIKIWFSSFILFARITSNSELA